MMEDEDLCIYYNEEDVPYPLCNGKQDDKEFLESECKNCCIYKDFEDDE